MIVKSVRCARFLPADLSRRAAPTVLSAKKRGLWAPFESA